MSTPVSALSVFAIESLQPTRPILINDVSTDAGIAHLAFSQNEIDLMRRLDNESFIRNYPMISYIPLDKKMTLHDDLYNESSTPAYNTQEAVSAPIYVRVDPPSQYLKKFGIEQEQEAIALISLSWFAKHAKHIKHTVGDRIKYYEIELEVLTVKFVDYIASTQVPLHLFLTLKNLKRT